MNRINILGEIIEYIEDHLDAAIDIGLLARKCGLSVYEFRRIFSFAAGLPIGEYIRKRRLSRAGEELLQADASITELAIKYGYDAPSSFSRAFKEFHGVSPAEVAKGESTLVLFSPLGFEAKVSGGTQSAYRLKKDTAFTVCGLSQVSEITDTECCEDAWSAFYASDSVGEVLGACQNKLYAVYENGENSVRCLIGTRGYEDPSLAQVSVPEALWMCFSFHGSEDKKVNEFYKTLFDCLAASRYEKDETVPNIEIFPENMEQEDFEWEIRIAVKEREGQTCTKFS